MSDQPGNAETTSTKTRWRWTNDLLAGLVVLAQVGVLAAAMLADIEVPGRLWDVFSVTILLATTWAFGRETLTAVREFIWGKQERRREPARSRRPARQQPAPQPQQQQPAEESTSEDSQPRDDNGRFDEK
ncbi:hypothetical protein [Halobacterium sp. KA-6]|uniref:hypothetical protein n=1 Tax=Halobacterium sp. KA-6 TaxID=2896368 RepID=UPI001E61D52B|nr:hypothetical protein [Halobacterium sp. KA-6]MCD2202736.1 hypothetical protein [Halobacterium sp. KA-6]